MMKYTPFLLCIFFMRTQCAMHHREVSAKRQRTTSLAAVHPGPSSLTEAETTFLELLLFGPEESECLLPARAIPEHLHFSPNFWPSDEMLDLARPQDIEKPIRPRIVPITSNVIRAARRITEKVKPDLNCRTCDFTAESAAHLTKHAMDRHTRHRACRYNTCRKEFDNHHMLLRHVRTHTGDKPFKCAICDKAFSDPSSFKRHNNVHREK